MARTRKEKMIDRLLTLYVIGKCRTDHNIRNMSETKMQKLVFLSEKQLIDNRCKAFNYRFIKLLHPTYSEELKTDLINLRRLGFLDGRPWYRENRKARNFLEDFHHVFENNRHIAESVDYVLASYAPIPTNHLVKRVNEMPWRNKTIADLKNGTPLLYPLRAAITRSVFQIGEEDFEDLAICLSPRISEGMKCAFDELRRGKRLTHEEVFR